MLPSDMNLRIGKVKNYNNKILIPSFNIGTNLRINLDGEKDKPDVKFKEVGMVKTEPDVKPKVIAKPNIEPNEKRKQDVKPNIKSNKELQHDTNKITYEEEKVALILGTTAVFTVWWMFKRITSSCLCHEICVDQYSNTCDKCPQILRQPTNYFLSSVQNP